MPLPARKPVYKGPPLRQDVALYEAPARPYKPIYSQAKSVPVDDVRAESLTPPPYAPPQFEVPAMLSEWFASLPAEAVKQLAPKPGAPNDPAAIEPASGVATYTLSMRFAPDQLTLNEPQVKVLSSGNFASIVQNPHQRIQIYSYASSKTGNESEARRISLARALEVRAVLTQQDIDARRIDIIAKGQQNQPINEQSHPLGTADRIEIISAAPGDTL